MKMLRLLMLTAFLPALGCLPTQTREPAAVRGKDVEVRSAEPEPEVVQTSYYRVQADEVNESNVDQQYQALREELLRDRTTVGSIEKARPTYAEKK